MSNSLEAEHSCESMEEGESVSFPLMVIENEINWSSATFATTLIGMLVAVTGLLKAYLEVRPLVPTKGDRIVALPGMWRGTTHQPDHPKGYIWGTVLMTLEAHGKRVSGKAIITTAQEAKTLEPAPNVVLTLQLKGGFSHASILRLDYANVDEAVLQLGTMYLELDATGRRLVGRFSGYGNLSGGVVHGYIKAEKEGS